MTSLSLSLSIARRPQVGDLLMDDGAALLARSVELSERMSRLRAEATMHRERAWQARLRATAACDRSAALRDRIDRGLPSGAVDTDVRWFSLTGELGGRPVWAQWSAGRLRCDPELLTQAQLVVELGTVFEHHNPPARVEATVTGEPAAVMLTLARACDRVVNVDFSRESPP